MQHCKRLPQVLSSVVKLFYTKDILSEVMCFFHRTWVFQFCHNFSLWIWPKFDFLSVVILWVLNSFVTLLDCVDCVDYVDCVEFCNILSLVTSEFYSFVTLCGFEFCIILSFYNMIFLRFVKILISEFPHNFSFWVG